MKKRIYAILLVRAEAAEANMSDTERCKICSTSMLLSLPKVMDETYPNICDSCKAGILNFNRDTMALRRAANYLEHKI